MSKCLPKRDELLLRIVFALPKPSMIGFVIISRGAISSATRWPFEVATCGRGGGGVHSRLVD